MVSLQNNSKFEKKNLNYLTKILCKIFLIGLLLQFYLQTFITYKLGGDGKIWTLVWMWKEFVLLIFAVIIIWKSLSFIPIRINGLREKSQGKEVSFKMLCGEISKKFIFKFIGVFILTVAVFVFLSLFIQKVGLTELILSFKYDLLSFFIFGVGMCLALVIFTEKDRDIIDLYAKIIKYSLYAGLLRWGFLFLMPTQLKWIGFNENLYEGTVGQNPPAAYYTNIYPHFVNSYVRNTYLFERPTSFGFWLIAFFPVFMLGFMKDRKRKDQITIAIIFGLLILSTWSRAGIAVRAFEAIICFFLLYRKFVKKHILKVILFLLIGLCGIAYLGRGIMVREHSNTGHMVLMKAGRDLASKNLITGRGAGYAGPASHQLCFSDENLKGYATIDEINLENKRCETIRKINFAHEITTYGFNPENQYLQVLIEYGIIGEIFWLLLGLIILLYTYKNIWAYRNKTKSPYQTMLYYGLIGFMIGLLGLYAEGLVLHSLADRMVIYPFFMLYGITLGLWENAKDVEYINEVKKKKKKKKKSKSK